MDHGLKISLPFINTNGLNENSKYDVFKGCCDAASYQNMRFIWARFAQRTPVRSVDLAISDLVKT